MWEGLSFLGASAKARQQRAGWRCASLRPSLEPFVRQITRLRPSIHNRAVFAGVGRGNSINAEPFRSRGMPQIYHQRPFPTSEITFSNHFYPETGEFEKRERSRKNPDGYFNQSVKWFQCQLCWRIQAVPKSPRRSAPAWATAKNLSTSWDDGSLELSPVGEPGWPQPGWHRWGHDL